MRCAFDPDRLQSIERLDCIHVMLFLRMVEYRGGPGKLHSNQYRYVQRSNVLIKGHSRSQTCPWQGTHSTLPGVVSKLESLILCT